MGLLRTPLAVQALDGVTLRLGWTLVVFHWAVVSGLAIEPQVPHNLWPLTTSATRASRLHPPLIYVPSGHRCNFLPSSRQTLIEAGVSDSYFFLNVIVHGGGFILNTKYSPAGI
jgi:hypothetical protein